MRVVLLSLIIILLRPGDTAPSFALRDANGKLHTLSDIIRDESTRVIIVSFISRTCRECKEEVNFHRELIKEYGNKGLKIIYLAVGEREDKLNDLKGDFKIPDEILILADKFLKGAEDYKVGNLFPQSFIIDKKRIIRLHVYGNTSHEIIRRKIEEALR